jgi:Ferritin-like domain
VDETVGGRGLTRGDLVQGALVTAGGAVVGAAALGGLPGFAASKPSPEQDAEILNFVLVMEEVQFAFYKEVLARKVLSGELLEFARIVGGQEEEHVRFVRKALGKAAKSRPPLEFGDATSDAENFAETALKLEDLGVAAYNAQAPNLTRDALAAAAQIVSVEAPHVAWIRDVTGLNPAPDAAEPTASAEKVMKTFQGSGFVR